MSRKTLLLTVKKSGHVEARVFSPEDRAQANSFATSIPPDVTLHEVKNAEGLRVLTSKQLGRLYTKTLGDGAVPVLSVQKSDAGLERVYRALMGEPAPVETPPAETDHTNQEDTMAAATKTKSAKAKTPKAAKAAKTPKEPKAPKAASTRLKFTDDTKFGLGKREGREGTVYGLLRKIVSSGTTKFPSVMKRFIAEWTPPRAKDAWKKDAEGYVRTKLAYAVSPDIGFLTIEK